MEQHTALQEFVSRDLTELVRTDLLRAIGQRKSGQRQFTYNVFDVRIEVDTSTAVIEDVLDEERKSVVELEEFARILRNARLP